MLILLPPSEGKTTPSSGAPMELSSLFLPTLTGERITVMGTLAAVSTAPDAAEVLGVGRAKLSDIEANLVLDTAPAGPAHQVFTGVLYDALVLKIEEMDTLRLLNFVPFDELLIPMVAVFAAAGMFVGIVGSWTSIRKFMDV